MLTLEMLWQLQLEHVELGEDRERAKDEKELEPVQEVPVPHAEVRKLRVGCRPLLPTKADIDEHFPLHLNFRSWCAHCRAGKSRLAQHVVEAGDRERLGVTVMMDYAFLVAEEVEEACSRRS